MLLLGHLLPNPLYAFPKKLSTLLDQAKEVGMVDNMSSRLLRGHFARLWDSWDTNPSVWWPWVIRLGIDKFTRIKANGEAHFASYAVRTVEDSDGGGVCDADEDEGGEGHVEE